MSRKAAEIAGLERLARLILDARLAELRQAAAAREASRAALEALNRPASAPGDEVPPLIQAQTELRYQAWADKRRAEINLRLERQTATWMERREAAAQAFGRAEALSRIAARWPRRG